MMLLAHKKFAQNLHMKGNKSGSKWTNVNRYFYAILR
jgi:hypothetical protein